MKQTNNAIKFLMAQYRAIFKNAYFKGMATALVLTAGLAASQAQADTTYYYDTAANQDFDTWSTQDSSAWSKQTATDGQEAKPPRSIAGSIGENGVVSGGSLTIGTGHDIASVGGSGSAIGGIIVDETTGGKNLTATSNKVILDKGAIINSGSAFGTYLHAVSGGNVVANENYVQLNAKNSGETISVGAKGDSDGIFGARIKTTNGNAFASGNYVEINAHKGATLTLGHGGNGIVGALAEGTGTVNVTGNKVTIKVDEV